MLGFPSRNEVALVRNRYPVGTRVMLEVLDDPYSKLTSGDCGTVFFVDDIGQIHVHWDRGSSIALIPGVDSFHTIKEG